MSIESARSFARGEVTREEVLALANRFREGGPEDSNGPYKVRTITDMLDSINSYATDILVSNGDLHIAGDLDLDVQLLVDGNLSVDGCYRDSDDPQTITLVTGDLTARDVITGGFLEVHGNLTCGRLLGDYNDCSAYISNNVTADLFYGEEHYFTIGGDLNADIVLGHPRLEFEIDPARMIELDDPWLLTILDPDLAEAFHDHDREGNPVTWIDFHFDKIKQRVAAGLPLLTPRGESESASGEPS
jgi:hypothetical protein